MRMLIFLFFVPSVYGATWYASPSGTSAGAGTIGSPWDLQTALNTNSVQSLDLILLRGGTYYGANFSSIQSGVTVKSYTNEWAVISDGVLGVLGTAISSNGPWTGIRITNSDTWISGNVVSIDNENFQLSSVSSGNVWTLNAGWNGTTKSNHNTGASVIPYGGSILYQSGSNSVFRDFGITSVMMTNRTTTSAFYPAGGLDLHGTGNKAINLIIYNTSHPGIGFWSQGLGGELNGCIIWGTGEYDYTPAFHGTTRGAGVYSQNESGLAQIKDCIFVRNFTVGAKVFGETGPVKDFKFDHNTCINNNETPQEMTSGSTSTSNTWMFGCVMTGTPSLSYVSTWNNLEYFYNNIIINGGYVLKETTNAVITNNISFGTKNTVGDGAVPIQYTSTLISSNAMAVTWDFNTYYIGDGDSAYQWAFTSSEGQTHNALGGGNLVFGNDSGKAWKDWTKFDLHSTCITNWPNNYSNLVARQLDYNSKRWFVSVVTTTGTTNSTLDLSTLGFINGNSYTLRDAQNYFTVIQSNIYSSGTINIPLNLTNVAAIPGVTNFVNKHSNVDQPGVINAFVLDNLGSATKVIGTATLGNGTW